MIIQSNPIIFVGLGEGAKIWEHISPTLNSFASESCYIEPGLDFDELWIKNEIGRVWENILKQGDITADIVRVNYIISTDAAGQVLSTLRKYVEKYLMALYPAGVLVDVYCLLNDNKLLDNDNYRMHVLAMLKDEQQKGANIYLLSNHTSQNVVIEERSTAHTIAMLTLFKDFVPGLYVAGADASRYNELYFYDNCYSKQGQFLTASSLNVTIPQDGLRALLIAELLSFGKNSEVRNIPISKSTFLETNITQQKVHSLEYLLGMALPVFSDSKIQSRRKWIVELFGERLNCLLETANTEGDPLPDLITSDLNFYDLIHLVSKGGTYENFAIMAVENCENEIAIGEENLKRWLDTVPDYAKGNTEKRKLSPLVLQELWPYTIALEFLQKQSNLNALQNKLAIFKMRQKSVRDARKLLIDLLDKVDIVIEDIINKSSIIDEAFAPFSPNASKYFRTLFAEYAHLHHKELYELSAKMTESFLQGTFDEYVRELGNYVDNIVLPRFSRPIMDTMHDLVSMDGRGDISTALGDWIFNHRRWNIRLKTGYASLHTEINVYMPTQGAAELKHRYEERGLGRMNLFADKSVDSVSVLYHSGAFNIEDLYYESLYVNNNIGE